MASTTIQILCFEEIVYLNSNSFTAQSGCMVEFENYAWFPVSVQINQSDFFRDVNTQASFTIDMSSDGGTTPTCVSKLVEATGGSTTFSVWGDVFSSIKGKDAGEPEITVLPPQP